MKLIQILQCNMDHTCSADKLNFKLIIDNTNYELYFSVDKKYGKYLCYEIADGVLTIMLPFAIRFGYDIVSNIPISEELFYNITYHLLPQISKCNNVSSPFIKAPVITISFNSFAVSTGISCGVDSFTTLKEYTEDCNLNNYKLTHLAFFENGSHHLGINGFNKKQKNCYEEQREKILNFCNQYGYPVVIVDSNINEVVSKAFNNDPYEYTHTYRNIGIVLQLQKLFKIYYYSSAYNIDSFQTNINEDPAKYEKYLFSFLTTNNTHIYSSNKAMTRIEKTNYISGFKQSHDNLLVCYMGKDNCGQCEKCVRTLITLDMLGKLNLYKNSFNIDLYKKNKPRLLINP